MSRFELLCWTCQGAGTMGNPEWDMDCFQCHGKGWATEEEASTGWGESTQLIEVPVDPT